MKYYVGTTERYGIDKGIRSPWERTFIQAKALHPQILTSVLSSSSSSKQLTNAWEDIDMVLNSSQN